MQNVWWISFSKQRNEDEVDIASLILDRVRMWANEFISEIDVKQREREKNGDEKISRKFQKINKKLKKIKK